MVKPIDELTLIKSISRYLKHKQIISENVNEIESSDYISDIQKQKKEIKKIPDKLKIIFKDELYPSFDKISGSLTISDLEKFNEKISEIALKYDIYGLKKYSEVLSDSIDYFDLNKIKMLLSDFPKIAYEIQNE